MGVIRAGVSFVEVLGFRMPSTARSVAKSKKIAMDAQRL